LTSLQETLEAERQSNSQMEGRKQAMIQQEELIASLQETISAQVSFYSPDNLIILLKKN